MKATEIKNGAPWLPVCWNEKTLSIADPYLVWASVVDGQGVRSARRTDSEQEWVQVLVEYEDRALALPNNVKYSARSWTTHHIAEVLTSKASKDLPSTATVTRIELSTAFDVPQEENDQRTVAFVVGDDESQPCDGKVLAVIDYGCPFLHAAYKSIPKGGGDAPAEAPGTSRIRYFWDQENVEPQLSDSLFNSDNAEQWGHVTEILVTRGIDFGVNLKDLRNRKSVSNQLLQLLDDYKPFDKATLSEIRGSNFLEFVFRSNDEQGAASPSGSVALRDKSRYWIPPSRPLGGQTSLIGSPPGCAGEAVAV